MRGDRHITGSYSVVPGNVKPQGERTQILTGSKVGHSYRLPDRGGGNNSRVPCHQGMDYASIGRSCCWLNVDGTTRCVRVAAERHGQPGGQDCEMTDRHEFISGGARNPLSPVGASIQSLFQAAPAVAFDRVAG